MFKANRKAGLAKLNDFLPSAGATYASRRNYDLGPQDRSNISTLSPWVRHRLVSEEEIIKSVLEHHSFSSANKFISEVYWRTYFKGWLEQHPNVWSNYRSVLRRETAKLEDNAQLQASYNSAISGRTGIECFDGWAKELIEIGYLHNHARMWFASIWIFTLRLPWVLGADFFYKHLLDGDPASNTLSWRWVAGLHTKGKHYVARADNIEKFTEGRFNPKGQLNEDPEPLTEDWRIDEAPMPNEPSINITPPAGLLLTLEDCLPETLPLPCKPASIGILRPDLTAFSPNVKRFKRGAMDDVQRRAGMCFGAKADVIQGEDCAEWASRNGLKQVLTAYAPVGETADQLSAIEKRLDREGVSLIRLLRPHDRASWPHATRGFFKLKKKIPELIADKRL